MKLFLKQCFCNFFIRNKMVNFHLFVFFKTGSSFFINCLFTILKTFFKGFEIDLKIFLIIRLIHHRNIRCAHYNENRINSTKVKIITLYEYIDRILVGSIQLTIDGKPYLSLKHLIENIWNRRKNNRMRPVHQIHVSSLYHRDCIGR